MAPLAGKHVLIVGGSSGLGFGAARGALAEGARVTLASSSAQRLRAAVDRLGGGERVRTEVVDVRDEESVKALFARVGEVDHLVYSAGDPLLGRDTSKLALDTLKSSLDVRYWGFILCARHGKPFIKDSISVTSGTFILRPSRGAGEVAGGAAALSTAARALALDLAPVRVNCLALGLVPTELWDAFPAAQREAVIQQYAKTNPVGRVGTVEEAAEAYLFAMKCTYLTGQTFFIDGGSTLV